MSCRRVLAIAVAAIGAVGTSAELVIAQSSITLYLVRTTDLSPLTRAEAAAGVPNPDNTLWIGHEVSAIAYAHGSLLVGGTLNGSTLPRDGADADGDGDAGEVTPFNIAIARVAGVLAIPEFSAVPASRLNVGADLLGYTGMDFAASAGLGRGLIAAYDPGGTGANQLMRYEISGSGTVSLAAPVPALVTGFRLGSAGCAWDLGPTGAGVDYAPGGAPDGVPDGPVVAAIPFGEFGPYGTDPNTLNAGFGATLYELGVNNGPRLAPSGEGQRDWRDLSIDPRNGSIAARANNTVVLCTRNANGTATRVDLAPANASTERLVTALASLPQQHVSIMYGFDPGGVGDLLVWNDRSTASPGQAFTSVVRFNKTQRSPASESGAPVTVAILSPDGLPAPLPAGTGAYDFFWASNLGVLFVSDAANHQVYALSAEIPRACCLSTGPCVVLNPTACASVDVGGLPGMVGSVCAPGLCPEPVLACCLASGTCQLLAYTPCEMAGGRLQGLGSVCQPNPCPQAAGACCNGAVCSVVAPSACTGTFRGGGTACEFAGNPVTCCRANINQVGGVTVQDIFDFLAAYFANQALADFNGNGSVTVQDIFDFLGAYFAGCS